MEELQFVTQVNWIIPFLIGDLDGILKDIGLLIRPLTNFFNTLGSVPAVS